MDPKNDIILDTMLKTDQKWTQNGIKNESDFKSKTDTRTATIDPRPWSPGTLLGGGLVERNLVQ